MFEFVRHWSRRSYDDPRIAEQGRLVLVTEAVNSVAQRQAATINAIAHEIGIDQSGASRLVKEAVAAGYLQTQPAETDTRRRDVTVTKSGLAMLNHAHQWQEEIFAQLTTTWTSRQRATFHQAMQNLLETSHALNP
ncbi:MarR family winged helix-turn-helix transcriptional regulator [Kribbella sp. NPDC023972]|uniref:MarR family winged helix-turn-helix transcriptional regulator n=1 Tax=Kribbella sp. NPDC023972 TaxID=3154795 RepID=UPI0033DEF4A2